MAHGAHRDRRSRSRLESFILDRDGRLAPLPDRTAPLASAIDSVEGLVAASVARTRVLQSDLHAAAAGPTFPERLRRWMHQQIINLEARNARMQQILTGGAPLLLRRPRASRAPARDVTRLRDLLLLVVVMTLGSAAGAAAIAGIALGTGLFGADLTMTLLGSSLAGAAMGLVAATLSIGVSIGRRARRRELALP